VRERAREEASLCPGVQARISPAFDEIFTFLPMETPPGAARADVVFLACEKSAQSSKRIVRSLERCAFRQKLDRGRWVECESPVELPPSGKELQARG
jgi:hypothetical protein